MSYTRQKITLPYFAPADQLPAPLPSFDEIVSKGQEYLCRPRGRHVVRVGRHFMVKYGVGIRLEEAENMLFVKCNCPDVNMPKVYAFYQQQQSGVSSSNGDPQVLNVIIMEYIPGNSLTREKHLDRSQRRAVTSSLKSQLAALRRIPQESSPAYYGALGRAPLSNTFWGSNPGPFASVDEYTDALFRLECPANPKTERKLLAKREEYREKFGRITKGKAIARGSGPWDVPVFTHADLHGGNVVLRYNDVDNTYIPFIIDWESAGWHPPFWEYVTTMQDDVPAGGWWHKIAKKILDDYSDELAILTHVGQMFTHRKELKDA
ncbi:hypothetical protein F5X99DRAFT_432423 [Biscogniauxia marginata]|nr:hypothetical protein F5X99DRAFT_432423 [Biscogniauxia marginata]